MGLSMRQTRTRSNLMQVGFTLIEVLVAMAVMAILAVMSWRGIEAMLAVQEVSERRNREISVLQTGLSQWMSDLNHVQVTGFTEQMFYDGKVFLITREDITDEQRRLRAVVWAIKTKSDGSKWLIRWQSPLFATRGGLFEAVENAKKWFTVSADATNDANNAWRDAVEVFPVNSVEMKAFNSANNSWVALKGQNIIPPGVRLEVDLARDWSVNGVVVRDWVRPTYTRRRSIAAAGSGAAGNTGSGQASGARRRGANATSQTSSSGSGSSSSPSSPSNSPSGSPSTDISEGEDLLNNF